MDKACNAKHVCSSKISAALPVLQADSHLLMAWSQFFQDLLDSTGGRIIKVGPELSTPPVANEQA
jgi:hypothetical protein